MMLKPTAVVGTATQGTPGSTYTTFRNVMFREWDFDFDQPIADGGCVVVQAATIDAGWN